MGGEALRQDRLPPPSSDAAAYLREDDGAVLVQQRRVAAAAVRVAHVLGEVAVRLGRLVVVRAVEALAQREGRRLEQHGVAAVARLDERLCEHVAQVHDVAVDEADDLRGDSEGGEGVRWGVHGGLRGSSGRGALPGT